MGSRQKRHSDSVVVLLQDRRGLRLPLGSDDVVDDVVD
jgi:hypothetical protein